MPKPETVARMIQGALSSWERGGEHGGGPLSLLYGSLLLLTPQELDQLQALVKVAKAARADAFQ